MNKLLLSFLTLAFIALGSNQAFSQQPKIAPEKEALIKELLEVTGSTKDVNALSEMMMGLQKAEAQKAISSMIEDDKTFSAEEKAMLKQTTLESMDRITKRVTEFFTKEVDLAKVLSDIATPLYDQNFSETELRELVAFYRSSIGQKTIALLPKLMSETMAGFSEKVMPKLTEFLKRTTDEEFAAIRQKVEQDMSAKKPKSKL